MLELVVSVAAVLMFIAQFLKRMLFAFPVQHSIHKRMLCSITGSGICLHQLLFVSFLQDLLLNKLLGEDFLTQEER
jgi:hypothetical protein